MSLNIGYVVPAFMKIVTGNYFNFDGRTNRYDFWHFYLGYFVLAVIVGFVAGMVGLPLLANLLTLALLLPTLGAAVRRVHDIGKAWFFMLIPFYNIWLFCQPGDQGANDYGEAPAPGGA